MIFNTWQPLLQFDKIKVIPEPWPDGWLRDSKPGYVFLLKGTVGTVGGLLRLTKEGLFITITAAQLYNAELIEWPGRNAKIKGIKIFGDHIELLE